MNPRLPILCLAALCTSLGAQAPTPLPLPIFQKRALPEILGAGPKDALTRDLPLVATFPSTFKVERSNVFGVDTTFLASPTFDLKAFVSQGRRLDNGDGYFTFTLSMNVAYIPDTDKFTGEGDPADVAKLEKAGMTHIRRWRADANGVPVWAATFEGQGRTAYLAYLALGKTRSAIRVTYYHPKVHTEQDALIWKSFIEGLGKR